ncbi:MAG: AsmA-like C-terminal region-containing protein [Limisphaera sp.]|nr:AsmA-like C-terminal region-containing protein [Limisphaera sp.]
METLAKPRRRRWPLWIGLGAAVLLLLLTVAWWVITSNAFFQAAILPRIGRTLNARVEVGQAEIRPFRGITLRRVQIRTDDREPLLEATELRVRYSLRGLWDGRIEIEECVLEEPRLAVRFEPDGRSNLDPVLAAFQKPAPAAPQPATGGTESLVFRVGQLVLHRGVVQVRRSVSPEESLLAEVADLELHLEHLGNAQTGSVRVAASIAAERKHPNATLAGRVASRLELSGTMALDASLQPLLITADGQLSVSRADGAWAPWKDARIQLSGEVEPDQVRRVALAFSRGPTALGQLTLQGPLSLVRREGTLEVGLEGVDARLLNLLGAAFGIDFGRTETGLQATLTLADGGRKLSAAGHWHIAPFQVRRANLAMSELQIQSRFAATLDLVKQALTLEQFHLTGQRQAQTWLDIALSAPMHLNWSTNAAAAVDEAALRIQIRDLDLKDWAPLVGSNLPTGRVQLQLDLLARNAGRNLRLHSRGQLQEVSVLWTTNHWTGLGMELRATAELDDWQRWILTNAQIHLTHQARPVATAHLQAQGSLPLTSVEGLLQATLALPACMQLLPGQTNVLIQTGTLHLTSRISRHNNQIRADGEARLEGTSGRFGATHLPPTDLIAQFSGGWDGKLARLSRLELESRVTGQSAGRFALQGEYRLDGPAGTFTGRLERVQQALLRPWLDPWLGPTRLLALECDGNFQGAWNAHGPSRLQAALTLTNLVVQPPNAQAPWAPLGARAEVDLVGAPTQLEIRQLLVALDPTPRATNRCILRGHLQRTDAQPWSGRLELTAESLDLTRYYDLWETLRPTATAPATTPRSVPTEPAPVVLPIHHVQSDARISRLLLRELDIRDVELSAAVQSNRVRLQPLRARINGAPLQVTADVNLGVPGFGYDLALQAEAVPLTPWVASFLPERRDHLHGTASVRLQLQGAGLTGPSLQKNLRGEVSLQATNLNLAVAQVRNPLLASLLDVVLGLPELIRNPTAVVGRLLGQLTGTAAPRAGWMEQLAAAPIQGLRVEARAGEGRVQVATAEVHSAAFQAHATGDIMLASDLAQSTLHIPVRVALERSLAERIGLASVPNQPYTPMPDFLTLRGTLVAPKAEVNRLALAGLAAASGASLLRNLGSATTEQAGNVLGTLGQLLGAPAPLPSTNAAATNAPPRTNAPPSLLDLLRPPRP